jgi:hypothetical protein
MIQYCEKQVLRYQHPANAKKRMGASQMAAPIKYKVSLGIIRIPSLCNVQKGSENFHQSI